MMPMYGPYSTAGAGDKRAISFTGNNIFKPIANVREASFSEQLLEQRLDSLRTEKRFYHLHRIDNALFFAAVDYFRNLGAEWCNLPLTTLMISSPGEVYAGKTLDYTTDTLPVDISWFGNSKKSFLSERSQYNFELLILIKDVENL